MVSDDFYDSLKTTRYYNKDDINNEFNSVERSRTEKIKSGWGDYIKDKLAKTFEDKESLDDFNINLYALITLASIAELEKPDDLGSFMVSAKLKRSFETSFGKSVEDVVVPIYPIVDDAVGWKEHPAKIEEMNNSGRTGENLIWQDIDKYCVIDDSCYLLSVKSGPNTLLEDTIDSMSKDINEHHNTWLTETQEYHPNVKNVEIVIGLTYGSDKNTNNKENKLLKYLIDYGFEKTAGHTDEIVIKSPDNRNIIVHRKVGIDFWSFVGNPADPFENQFIFLEVLIGFILAVEESVEELDVDEKNQIVSEAIKSLNLSKNALPDWVEDAFDDEERTWLAYSLTQFFDDGAFTRPQDSSLNDY